MNKLNITIDVAGPANSGKTTILALIKKLLKEQGFSVSQEMSIDFKTEQDFDRHTQKNMANGSVPYIAEKVNIKIKETQTRREDLERENTLEVL